MNYVLALDQGTTSSRAIIYDESMMVKGTGQCAFEQIYPEPGWVEHDPETIWQSMLKSIKHALQQASLGSNAITAIGITNQRETLVVWDRISGKPIHNAIVWQDRRTADLCEKLASEGLEDFISEKTGLVLDPYFSATKIRWILDHIPAAKSALAQGSLVCGTIDSWLVWKLTQGKTHIIEASNASRTSLLNLDSVAWDEELLRLFNIPQSILPSVVGSSEHIALSQIPELKGVPITGIAGDQQAALFGQTCFDVGDTKCTYGTGCFLLTNTGAKPVRSKSRLLSTVAWRINNETTYALEGSVFIGGALVQWLRDNLSIVDHASEIEALAASVADNGGVTLVPAFAGLGAPYWDPQARGTILGLTRGTTSAHIARAALEGIAMQVTDVIEAMRGDMQDELSHMKVDGGASANNLLMQIQADYCALNISRAKNLESTALGAATLAGLGVGIWDSAEKLRQLWQPERQFSRQAEAKTTKKARNTWLRAVERARHWQIGDE